MRDGRLLLKGACPGDAHEEPHPQPSLRSALQMISFADSGEGSKKHLGVDYSLRSYAGHHIGPGKSEAQIVRDRYFLSAQDALTGCDPALTGASEWARVVQHHHCGGGRSLRSSAHDWARLPATGWWVQPCGYFGDTASRIPGGRFANRPYEPMFAIYVLIITEKGRAVK
jgi:hypothetical protein